MKLVCVLIITTFMHVSAASFAQVVSLNMENASIKEILDKFQEQTDYSFIIGSDLLMKTSLISVNFKNKPLKEALEKCFEDQPLEYSINKKTIVIKSKKINKPREKIPVLLKNIQQAVSGLVVDSTGIALPGASVVIKGTNVGTQTDNKGEFSFPHLDEETILLISFTGFISQEVPIKGKTQIRVVLKEDKSELGEVVVVGFGTQRKESVVGAISTVNVEDINIPTRSLTNALAGRLAGTIVLQRTGELGNDNSGIWIRGLSTFGPSRAPLVLVDGVERDMQDLSVEEIGSVSVLKDASATAVYGVRAANGVILITTRRGIEHKPSVEFRTEYGVSDLPTMPKFLDGANYAMLYNEAFGSVNYSPEYIENVRNQTDPYLYPDVNWYDELYKKFSNNSRTSLNFRGGGKVAKYFVSVGYLNESGNLKDGPENEYKSNLNLQRYNFRSNIDISISNSTTIDLEVGGSLTDLHTPASGGDIWGTNYSPVGGLFYWASLATPISSPTRIPIGLDVFGNQVMGFAGPSQLGEMNPLERLTGSGFITNYKNQVMSQITLNQDLSSLVDGLGFKFSYSFDAYGSTSIRRNKTSSYYSVQGRDSEGELLVNEISQGNEFLSYERSLGSNRAKEMKSQFLYNTKLGNDHNISAMLMYYQRDYINGNASSAILSLPYRRQGVAFRTTYDYNNRYFIEYNMGYNGSENFPKEIRFGFFPAVAAGWILSNEPFFQPYLNSVNLLKLKGSIGLVGAEALPGGQRYGYLSIYGAGLGGYNFGENGKFYGGTGENRIGVKDLTWEKGLKHNIGFELGLFNRIISLEADYFYEKRTDILLQRSSLPWVAGVSSAPFANMGEMRNQGVDATLEVQNRFRNGDGGFRIYGNFTYAKDKILAMDEAPPLYDYTSRTGQKYGQQFGLIALGYFVDDEDVKNSPEQTFGVVRPGDVKFLDVNGDGLVDGHDMIPIGHSNLPEINYGFGYSIDWRGFDVGMFFRGQARVTYSLGGAYVPFTQGVGKGNLFTEALDRWTVENPDQNARYPRISNGRSTNNWASSTKTIYNGSFLRLTDVEVGYNIKGKVLSNLKMRNVRFYVLANNVAVFAPWKMWDPESGVNDGRNYPLQRKVNFGVRATI